MQRYFVTPEQFEGDRVEITGDDARHITKVMRGRLGDKLIVSDGASREAMVEIESIEAAGVFAVVIEPMEMTQEPRLQVSIAQSLPKGDKMETVIQKCTEIGAVSFVPFLSDRTIVQYDAKKEGKRLERWRKIAKEAAEQAHRNRIPSVEQPLSWKNLLAAFSGYDAVYFVMKRAWLPAEGRAEAFCRAGAVEFGRGGQPAAGRWTRGRLYGRGMPSRRRCRRRIRWTWQTDPSLRDCRHDGACLRTI